MSNRIWYLAHPVREDLLHTQYENLQHALFTMRTLLDAGVKVVMPWYAHIIMRGEADEAEHELGISIDTAIVPYFGGVILSGHRLSSGMRRELDAAGRGAVVHNLIGVSDDLLPSFVRGLSNV